MMHGSMNTIYLGLIIKELTTLLEYKKIFEILMIFIDPMIFFPG